MKNEYDIVIIGAGIAGCGLTYNLNKIGYQGKILIIDKKCPGAAAAYGYRNTFTETIKEYNLPYEHKYKQILFGTYEKIFTKVPADFHFINYKKACQHLLKNSKAKFKKEEAIKIGKGKIKTDKSEYTCKHIIDCSGNSFFAKKILRHNLPFRYWAGETQILENEMKEKESYYHLANSQGFLEDIYPLQNKTLIGKWKYTRNTKIKLAPTSSLTKKTLGNIEEKETQRVLIPCTPSLPIVDKEIIFLGDSFGNSSASTAEGIRPILNTSKMLAKHIKNKTIKEYEKEWKKKFLKPYTLQLATKLNYETRLFLLQLLKNNPEIFIKIAKNEKTKIPPKILIKIPPKMALEIFLNYRKLKKYYNKF